MIAVLYEPLSINNIVSYSYKLTFSKRVFLDIWTVLYGEPVLLPWKNSGPATSRWVRWTIRSLACPYRQQQVFHRHVCTLVASNERRSTKTVEHQRRPRKTNLLLGSLSPATFKLRAQTSMRLYVHTADRALTYQCMRTPGIPNLSRSNPFKVI